MLSRMTKHQIDNTATSPSLLSESLSLSLSSMPVSFLLSWLSYYVQVLSKICDRLAKLETDHDEVKDKCTQMQTEIDQLKTDVRNKDEEIQKKDSEVWIYTIFISNFSSCLIVYEPPEEGWNGFHPPPKSLKLLFKSFRRAFQYEGSWNTLLAKQAHHDHVYHRTIPCSIGMVSET